MRLPMRLSLSLIAIPRAVLGQTAQEVMGHAGDNINRTVNAFLSKEVPLALTRLFCNIGPVCSTNGVMPGVVIASPDRKDPDYFYTWTRDSALVFKALADRLSHSNDHELQRRVQDYVVSQVRLQPVSNPSGSLWTGAGLGEPKFHVDLTPFTESWGRPQRDGPALRAITIISYANWLVSNGYTQTVRDILWPVIKNDLAYVAQYWNSTGFDLWEEVEGSSFFTVAAQHRALIEGDFVARSLGEKCEACEPIASQIRCLLRTFWSPKGDGYIVANVNADINRSGKDSSTILASIHSFDPFAYCDSVTFQPCSEGALANHKAVTDAFRGTYALNRGLPSGAAVAVGRYTEDVYFGGNPWYLTTLAAAEQLYDALIVWKRQGFVDVTPISYPFFRDLNGSIFTGRYGHGNKDFYSIIDRVTEYADGFVALVATYAAEDGSLAEQFDKDEGHPLSARDLTWSYAALLTAADRRAGIAPPSWGAYGVNPAPSQCKATSVIGTYVEPTQTTFPPSQTPKPGNGLPERCPVVSDVVVTFKGSVETTWGTSVKVVGSVPELGNWNVGEGLLLDASGYSAHNPVWGGTLTLRAGDTVEYKYVRTCVTCGSGGSGETEWETGPNRMFTVPTGCGGTATREDKWRT